MKPAGEIIKALELEGAELDEAYGAIIEAYEAESRPVPAAAVGKVANHGVVELTETGSPQSSEELLATLSPERQAYAKAVQAALAEKRGLESSDFEAINVVGENGEQKVVIMNTRVSGIYKGNWRTIFDERNEDDFMIKVDGVQIDTRMAMTWAAYQGFIDAAKARGQYPLPDSPELDAENDGIWTDTWLSGEKAGDFDAELADVHDSEARHRPSIHDRFRRDRRVRDAVEV